MTAFEVEELSPKEALAPASEHCVVTCAIGLKVALTSFPVI